MKWHNFRPESPFGIHCTNWYESSDHLIGQSSNCLLPGS